jgi:hypothetical protein
VAGARKTSEATVVVALSAESKRSRYKSVIGIQETEREGKKGVDTKEPEPGRDTEKCMQLVDDLR